MASRCGQGAGASAPTVNPNNVVAPGSNPDLGLGSDTEFESEFGSVLWNVPRVGA